MIFNMHYAAERTIRHVLASSVFYHKPSLSTVYFFRYFPPSSPGYNTEMFEESVKDYTYPSGKVWKSLFKSGKYKDPSRIDKRLV